MSTWLAALAVVVLGSGGVVLRIWDQGDSQRTASLVLLGASAMIAIGLPRGALRLGNATRAALVVVSASALVVAVSVPIAGRAPAALVVTCTLMARAAMGRPRQNSTATPCRLAVLLLTLTMLIWWRTGNNYLALLGLVSTTAATISHWAGLPASERVDRQLRRVERHVGTAVSNFTRSTRALAGRSRECVERGCTAVSHLLISVRAFALRSSAWLKSRAWIDPAGLGVAVAVASVPAFHRLVTDQFARVSGFNDMADHVLAAKELTWSPFDIPPQGLFHIASWAAAPLVGTTTGATLVLAASAGLAAAGLVRLGRLHVPGIAPLGRKGAAAFAIWFLVAESPVVLLLATGLVGTDTSFSPIHLWASPTETLAVGLCFVLLPILLSFLADRTAVGFTTTGALVAAVGTLATFAKPTFTLALVPALPTYLLVTRAHRSFFVRTMVWCVAPVLLALAVQFVIVSTLVQPEHRGGITIAPFETVSDLGLGRGGAVFFLVALIPVVAVAAAGRRYFRDPGVVVTGLALLFAVGAMLLFRETGPRAYQGNVAAMGNTCWTLLLACSVRVAIENQVGSSRSSWRKRPVLAAVSALFAATAFLAGFLSYLDAVGAIEIAQPARGPAEHLRPEDR